MPRGLREQVAGGTYHVTARAVADTTLVRGDGDRQSFLDHVAAVASACGWSCLAVAILDNHYHLLVTISEPNLSRGMQRLNGGYAAFFNRKYGRKGHLFGARFYSGPIVGAGHLLMTIRYIARNRSAAAIVDDPATDRWSSYPGVVGKAPCWPFIARSRLLALIGPAAIAVRILEDLVEGRGGDGGATPYWVRPP